MRHVSSVGMATLLLLAALPSLAAEPDDPDLFRSETARIEIRKPADWHFQSLESSLANRANVRLKDEDLQKAVEQFASTPLLVATRHEEPYDRLNPSFQVLVRPAGRLEGKTALEILHLVLPVLRSQFEGFSPVDSLREVQISGKLAARMTNRYTVRTPDGRAFPTQGTIIMIPRGKLIYQFGFSAPPEGPDALTTEVEAVLKSVKLLE